ncbi:MAG: FecR domain-containing protein [Candidatus Riflebacteria bacterium]|nr:FecR domain-containing protein [Candidatus Riflebacteria bacterium]
MRIVDEVIFRYPDQDEDARRWSLTVLEDTVADADLAPRIAFLSDRLTEATGLLRHQSLATFAALLPAWRLAGWSGGVAPLAAVPILDAKEVVFDPNAPVLVQFAHALGVRQDAVESLEQRIQGLADPFPLAFGLAHRRRSRRAVLSLVEERASSLPELGLLCSVLYGKSGGRAIQKLARSASPGLKVSLLRALPHHPERGWARAFRTLTDLGDPWVGAHALTALGRIATPQAAAMVVELARSLQPAAAKIQAVRSGARIGGTQATEIAIESLDHGDPEVQGAALDALLSSGHLDERLDRAAERLRRSDDPRVRCLSLAVLARGRSQQILEKMSVKDPSRTVACTAIRALVHSRGGLTVKTFREVLARGGAIARAAAEVLVWRAAATPGEVFEILGAEPGPGPGLLALGVASAATGAREGLAVLAAALASSEPQTLAWAVEGLYPLGSAVPRRLLMPCLKTRIAPLQARVAVALTLGGDPLGPDILRALWRQPQVSLHGARGLLDLAAILPTMQSHPMFIEAGALVHGEPHGGSGPDERPAAPDMSTSDITIPRWTEAELADPNISRFDGALSGQWLPTDPFPTLAQEGGAPQSYLDLDSKAGPGAVSPIEALASNLGSDEPACRRCPTCGQQLGAAPAAATPPPIATLDRSPGGGPDGAPRPPSADSRRAGPPPRAHRGADGTEDPAARVASSWRRSVILAGALACLIAGLAGGLRFVRGTVLSVSPAATPATEPAADLGFVPLTPGEARLTRGSEPERAFGPGDVLAPGDTVATRPDGKLVLTSSGGSRIELGPDSRLVLGRGSAEARQGRQGHAIELSRGAVLIDWAEPDPLRLELSGGAMEARRARVVVQAGRAMVPFGEARWIPRDGPARPLQAGTSVELPGAR